ncbi:sensor domain-containing diguanylate cyclase [Acetobacterium malicum]|uniref:sensor domain-containing diguanylate cyclase n=1 Tax=Acetobacterium malicum TaxID=52692 RepID=UPI0035932148
MGRISFRKAIMIVSFVVFLMFSLFLFFYFEKISYQDIKERLISENSYSAQSAKQFLDAEKDSMAKDARFVVNYPATHFAFVNGKYIDFNYESAFNISNPEFEEMSAFNYKELSFQLSRILGKTLYASSSSVKNVAFFDGNANPLSDVPGIEDSFMDTGKENYIHYMISDENKFSSIEPLGVIALKEGRLFLKGVDRIYSGEPKGVTVVTEELGDSILENIKNSVNKEIVILAEDGVKLSTINIDKNAFGNIFSTSESGGILFETLKINNREMGFSFYPIEDFDGKIIAYIGTGFDMNTVNDIFINNLIRFIPVVVVFSLMLFLILYALLRQLFKPLNEIISITEEISRGNYKIEYPSNKIIEFTKILESIGKMSDAIEIRENELVILSSIDKLTQIYNRQKTEEILRLEIQKSNRTNHALSIIMLDIDRFKEVNDTYGHKVGDMVLEEFVNITKKNIRTTDFIGRWGGEEFLIICPETNIEGAKTLANKLRRAIEEHKFPIVVWKTASFGVAEYLPEEEINTVMKRADDALYKAKKLGRNRVECEPDI